MMLLLFIFNFCISVYNACGTGLSWAESKAMGGFARLLAWSGAIMAACGFSWCLLLIAAWINSALPEGHQLPARYAQLFFDLGYLGIVIPLLGSGLVITIQSWSRFWRERTFTNGGVAGYNTFAQIYNTYRTIDALPSIISSIIDCFSGSSGSDDDDDDEESSDVKGYLIAIAVILAISCILGGILLAAVIVRYTANQAAFKQSLRAVRAKKDAGRRMFEEDGQIIPR